MRRHGRIENKLKHCTRVPKQFWPMQRRNPKRFKKQVGHNSVFFLFVARRIWAGRDEGEAARKRLTLEGLDKKNQIIKEAQVSCFKLVIVFCVCVNPR